MKNIFPLLLLCWFSFANVYAQKIEFYENLVFEGAGLRGIAYSGVLKKLEEAGICDSIKRVGGTSAGAITALLVALGYQSDEIYQIVSTTKFQKFNDGQFIFIGGFYRLFKKYGWYRGNAFDKWLSKIIKQKTDNENVTFAELSKNGFKDLYITATCLNRQKLLVFSSKTYPQMKIKDAVRISMTIPFYFEAVFIDSLGKVYPKNLKYKNLDVVVDGGIIGNFPIFMFDSIYSDATNKKIRVPNYKTIGIRIDAASQIKSDSLHQELVSIPIYKMKDYVNAFYNIVLENLNRHQLSAQDWERSIAVSSVGISPKIKRLSRKEKQKLIESGEKHTVLFLQKAASKP